ncbi:hypothetical protein ACSBR1_033032 [Camellia fascicularis]
MESENRAYRVHCLILPFPLQGHINPMLQFSKRLQSKQIKVTLVATRHMFNTTISEQAVAVPTIPVETISDGYDQGIIKVSPEVYQGRFREVGSQTLAELVEKLCGTEYPVDCIVCDSILSWVLEVAKRFGLVGAVFFTQSCAVDNIYYHVYKGLLDLPLVAGSERSCVAGLPPLETSDLPSFLSVPGSYLRVLELVVNQQMSNVDRVDFVLCNTFYELEKEVVDWMAKFLPLRTIGPTIPSMFLDKRLQDDTEYGLSIFKPNTGTCMNWLEERPNGSVVYVSFGSLAELGVDQMEELAWGLGDSNYHFLWVVRSKEEAKLPKDFVRETSEKGLVVSWCPQLQVLAHKAVGCFVTHCGWNSTLEALSLGVPMVAMPQWTDQSTNAKYVMDVWRMGLRVRCNDKGIVRRDEIEHCVREVMEGERGKEMKRNAIKWSELAKEAVGEGGSSDRNIHEIVAKLGHSTE